LVRNEIVPISGLTRSLFDLRQATPDFGYVSERPKRDTAGAISPRLLSRICWLGTLAIASASSPSLILCRISLPEAALAPGLTALFAHKRVVSVDLASKS
jgi:hypothetical protein